MPCVAATHAAISGSRSRPCAVYAFPEKPVPKSLASAARAIARSEVRVATSVAVIPRERARTHATRSRESATMRAASSGVTLRGYAAARTCTGRDPPRRGIRRRRSGVAVEERVDLVVVHTGEGAAGERGEHLHVHAGARPCLARPPRRDVSGSAAAARLVGARRRRALLRL